MKGKIVKIEPVENKVRIICASGTPVPESPMYAYPFLDMVTDNLLPSRRRFARHFVRKEKQTIYMKRRRIRKMVTVGFKNLPELKTILQAYSIRRLQEEVEGMPEKVFIVREAEMTRDQKKLYKEIRDNVVEELTREGPTLSGAVIKAKTLRLRQLLNHPGIVDPSLMGVESGKHLLLDDILAEIFTNPDAKAVVWTNWLDGIDILKERYKMYNAGTICGRTPQGEIDDLRENFETNDVRVVFCTPDKAGTGVDYLQRARYSIVIERPYSAVMDKQKDDRINRRGAQGTSVHIRIKVPGSVDDFVDYTLERKQGISEALVTSDETLVKIGKADLLKFLVDC